MSNSTGEISLSGLKGLAYQKVLLGRGGGVEYYVIIYALINVFYIFISTATVIINAVVKENRLCLHFIC